jgi:hypothetical protein
MSIQAQPGSQVAVMTAGSASNERAVDDFNSCRCTLKGISCRSSQRSTMAQNMSVSSACRFEQYWPAINDFRAMGSMMEPSLWQHTTACISFVIGGC